MSIASYPLFHSRVRRRSRLRALPASSPPLDLLEEGEETVGATAAQDCHSSHALPQEGTKIPPPHRLTPLKMTQMCGGLRPHSSRISSSRGGLFVLLEAHVQTTRCLVGLRGVRRSRLQAARKPPRLGEGFVHLVVLQGGGGGRRGGGAGEGGGCGGL